MRIEVFADIVCPFTHVGLRRLRDMRAERGSKTPIAIHAWPLELVNGEPVDRNVVAREIAALRTSVAPELFAGFDRAAWPVTSIPAFGLVTSAYAHDDATGEAISFAVRDALFEQGLDVADRDVLRHIGAPYGVEPLTPAAADAAARRDFERGRNRLVRGSPHFFVGSHDWFCPGLHIVERGNTFDIEVAGATMEEFYGAAFA
jgi:predicted DsbA family dithiol-disulfide isomerase